MKTFIAFVKKEFRHIFRDKRTLIVLFGMPIAQIILFGYAITTDVQNARIAVLDRSRDNESTALVRKVLSSGYFEQSVEAFTYDDIEEAFRRGKIKLAVVLPQHFAEDYRKGGTTIQLIADGSDPNTASTLVSYMNALVMDHQRSLVGGLGGVNLETVMHYNHSQKSVYMFVPGVITIVLLLVNAMLTSIAITREKEMGNMEILLVSPLSPATIIIGKVVPYLLLSVVNVTVIISLSAFLFAVPIHGSLLLLLGEGLLFVVCALSLGVLISTIAKSQQVALMLSLMVLMLPTILLSNFIFPISSMPKPLQWISVIIPAKYFIVIIKGIMLKGVGLEVLWHETLVLAGMTLFFILVSTKRFKVRL